MLEWTVVKRISDFYIESNIFQRIQDGNLAGVNFPDE